MNRLHETEDEQALETDREISLGMPTILGIFFAIALVCACFFGFGYSLGRKSVPSAAVAVEAAPGLGSGAAKPAAGSPAAAPAAAPPDANPNAPAVDLPPSAVIVPNGPAAATPPSAKTAASPADGLIAGDKIPASAPQPAAGASQPATSFMVQVAAVSSQDVADIELAALKKDGYAVVVRHEPQDQLLHIQIGPFATRKDAEAMRQRVLADGFNAIVK
jgi:cell division septation protein DedD